MGERVSQTSTVSTPRPQLAFSARASRPKDYRGRSASTSAAQQSRQQVVSAQLSRQFRHVLNGKLGIESLCVKCGESIASAEDEWLLLEHERRHVCSKAQ